MKPGRKTIVGFIVNPIAGMGGSVGLKGTDDGLHHRAIKLGAVPIAPQAALTTLTYIKSAQNIHFLSAPGIMGGDYFFQTGIEHVVVGTIAKDTSSDDTITIVHSMAQQGAELIVFVGGDGTARNIYDAIALNIPVVAVPAGVKVYSAVFAFNPRDAASLINNFTVGTNLIEKEVLDIDEEAFREHRLSSRLYGYLSVPELHQYMQPGKTSSILSTSETVEKDAIAEYIIENMEDNTLYLLGPGTTIKPIAEKLHVEKSLLGIDAIYDGKMIASDINEENILNLLKIYPSCKILVTPIGGNGFIFGRGNRPFTPRVIQHIGKENITIISTNKKAFDLQVLRVDMGDEKVDRYLSGYWEVITGFLETRMMKVIH